MNLISHFDIAHLLIYFKKLDDILALDSGALETFRPGCQSGLGQTFLTAREAKGKTQWQFLDINFVLVHKSCQTLGNVVE